MLPLNSPYVAAAFRLALFLTLEGPSSALPGLAPEESFVVYIPADVPPAICAY